MGTRGEREIKRWERATRMLEILNGLNKSYKLWGHFKETNKIHKQTHHIEIF